MIETSFQSQCPATSSFFVVIQLSPRRWAVAEQSSITRPNEEFRIITKAFANRIDAQQACSEIAGKPAHEYSALTREHVLDLDAIRGNSSPRSRLLAGWKN